MRADVVLKAGEAKYYKTYGGTRNRWGDFSYTMVDPVNDVDFWTIQEYAWTPGGGYDRWSTWWGRIIPPPLAFNKTSPANGATSQPANPTLSWGTSSNATSYEYCIDTTNNSSCDASWISTAASTSVGLSGLSPTTIYYWQVRANNSGGTTYSNGSSTAFWSFTTTDNLPTCYALTLGKTGSGSPPTASPTNSEGCSSGEYVSGETINVVSHPASGYHVGSWTGTINDSSTSLNNQVSMPSGNHNVIVHYEEDYKIYLPIVNLPPKYVPVTMLD
jgi:hypothetical protein